MADNISITPGSGNSVATDDIGGIHYQRVKITSGADGTATDVSAAAPLPTVQTGALPAGTNNIGDVDVLSLPATPAGSNIIGRVGIDQTTDGTTNLVAAKQSGTWTISTVTPGTAATNLGKAIDSVAGSTDTGVALLATRLDTLATLTPASGDYASPRLNARGAQWVEHDPADPALVAITKTVGTTTATYTRPGDTTLYAAGDCLSNSTSAPTAGGLTFTVASANGKGGFISGLSIISNAAPATPLQGELHLFDTAPTAINDNAAFTVSNAEMLRWVGMIPFALSTIGANSQGLVECNLPFTTVSATTLRGLVRVVNAYTPANAEVLTFRLKYTPVG